MAFLIGNLKKDTEEVAELKQQINTLKIPKGKAQ